MQNITLIFLNSFNMIYADLNKNTWQQLLTDLFFQLKMNFNNLSWEFNLSLTQNNLSDQSKLITETNLLKESVIRKILHFFINSLTEHDSDFHKDCMYFDNNQKNIYENITDDVLIKNNDLSLQMHAFKKEWITLTMYSNNF